ncbi:MAG: filamentous hemagglutinin N-terminal domain-containing protein [Oscillatoria sp. PMC 1051.18]|nr:filamentous hemagglutinin N-terminal domain-containing protein [Oscillatoria sp. PMC 1050.18]MEC5029788.1 filamentous hemagglutinin N-terminal domain-containing protein [Oscillatoria sp. PMC 1051.18]
MNFVRILPVASLTLAFSLLTSISETSKLKAQLIPDATLGAENSRVNAVEELKDLITGGATRGSNLFHSFLEFNISEGSSVYFANPDGIENILTRVTGSNASNIFGVLGVEGTANLFLLNPNGILFGENASLDIRGSFVASSANAIQLGENGIFSATNPENSILLNVQPNALFSNSLTTLTAQQNQIAGVVINPGEVLTIEAENSEPTNSSRLIPDDTLGTENSLIITSEDTSKNITGGATHGANLFHSFSEFNVEIGERILFENPAGVERIFSRVTGENSSEILGNLGVSGTADLFFINPNGINFGENARLTVSGSFVASTADAIGLGTTGLFSATNPENSNLLSVAPTALYFNLLVGKERGSIVNQSISQETGLAVPPQQTLALVGGDIFFDGGIALVGEGRIELGSVDDGSIVEIETAERGYALNYEQVENFRDIELNNSALVDVSGFGSGEVQIQARRLTIANDSLISGQNQGTRSGGNIIIKASETVELIDATIRTGSTEEATATGGNVTVNTETFSVLSGGEIKAFTSGIADSGNLTINATNVEIINNNNPDSPPSGLFVEVQTEATGNGGILTINTENLTVQNGGLISSSTLGGGDAGDLLVNAHQIQLIGNPDSSSSSSGFYSDVLRGATGNGGSITVNSNLLNLVDGAVISASTFSEGNAGALTINSTEINLIGALTNNQSLTGFLSDVKPEASGDGGTITINTERFTVSNGARIGAGTFGEGNGANVLINATEIEMLGNSQSLTGFFSDVQTEATGDGGNITINTERLLMLDGATIAAGTFSEGKPGNVFITADDIQIIDTNREDGITSTLESQSRANQVAGNLSIEANNFVIDGSRISVSNNNGAEGSITIQLSESLNLLNNSVIAATTTDGIGGNLIIETPNITLENNSVISAEAFGEGQAGSLTINSEEVFVRQGSNIFVSSRGTGNAGQLQITANNVLLNNGSIIAETNQGSNANIQINLTESLSLANNSNLSASALGNGEAGSLSVNTDLVSIRGNSGIFVNSSGSGDAGQLSITANNVFVDSGSIRAETNLGANGNIILNLTESLSLENNASISASTRAGTGGNLTVNAPREVNLVNNSNLTASARGDGKAGALTLNTDVLVISGGNSGVFVNSLGSGDAGELQITARNIFLNDGVIGAETNLGGNGNIFLDLSESLRLDNRATISAATNEGNGGNLIINAPQEVSLNNSILEASARGDGEAGSLAVNTNLLLINGEKSGIFVNSLGGGDAGQLSVTANNVFLDSGSIRAETNLGGNGNIILDLAESLRLDNQATISAATQEGTGGNLTVIAPQEISLNNNSNLNASATVTGEAGSLNIETGRLEVLQNSEIAVSSTEGIAGSLNIIADEINLNQGTLSAETAQADRGNITLTTTNLELQNNSAITTNATGSATGGNITTDAKFIIVRENSSISANAIAGSGGNIQITAEGVFLDNTSAITATSERGIDGTIEINTQVDPTQGIVELSTETIDVESLVARDLCRLEDGKIAGGSSFIITGRGGLPTNPTQPLTPLTGIVEWFRPQVQTESKTPPVVRQREIATQQATPIIRQAQGWVTMPDGTIVLTANAPQVTSQGVIMTHPNCQAQSSASSQR